MIAAARSLPFTMAFAMCGALDTKADHVALRDSVLAKCRKIVVHFRHSPATTAELKAQQPSHGLIEESLVQDVLTRWNSTLGMIRWIQHNKDPLKARLAQQKQK